MAVLSQKTLNVSLATLYRLAFVNTVKRMSLFINFAKTVHLESLIAAMQYSLDTSGGYI